MKALSEPNITTYHYEYDPNGNRTQVEIKDDGLTLESTVYTYDRLNKLVSSREVTASGLYLYEYTYDDNGNLIKEDRHRAYELNTNQWTNIRRYEYTKDNKLESVYSGNTLLVSYTYDGDGTITSSFERDLDLNQNLNIHDTNYINSLTNNQRQLINKVSNNDSFLYELTEYITDKNRPYSETFMERDGTGQLSTIYTYGNQRISTESYNNLSGLYTYDGRGSVSAVIGGYGDFRASYWYDGLGNVKSQIHGYGAFGSGKKYYGYNAEQYNPVTGNQNLRARQLNIRRQRFLTEDTFIGTKNNPLTINRYIYGNGNPLKYKDPSGNFAPLVWAAISLGAGVITGVATGIATGDWKKGLAVGAVTTLSVVTGGIFAEVAGGAAVTASMTSTGVALSSSMAGAATGTISRGVLGNAVLGEKNSPMKIANDTLRNTTFAVGTTAVGIGINNFINGNSSAYQYGDITRNASYVNPYGTGANDITDDIASYLSDVSSNRIGQEMAGATANSGMGGCVKAPVDYSGSSSNNPLEDINYSSRVKGMMSNNENDPFHAFPEAVDAFGDTAKESIIIGGDGIPRTKYELDGWYRGKEGTFEYIVESDKSSNHRLFRPK